MDDLRYYLALYHAPGIGPARFNQLYSSFPNLAELFEQPELLRQRFPAATTQLINYLSHPDWAIVDNDLSWSHESGQHILTLEHPDYPILVKQIDCPPPVLYVRGGVEVMSQVQLAMVGSRNPTPDGKDNAYEFAKHLAASGLVITSGLAIGVDVQCHRGSLDANGSTIAVIGSGQNKIYPARHKYLAEEICNQGAIVSEFPLETAPNASNFPRRNRLISALSVGTLVVEGSIKSGSLITARYALEQGREIFAIPGSIHNPLAKGCHALIRQGAKLVETAQDIMEEIASLALASQSPWPAQEKITNPGISLRAEIDHLLPKVQQHILKNLGYTPVSIDVVTQRTGLPAEEVSANLVLMELENRVIRHPGNRFGLASASSRA